MHTSITLSPQEMTLAEEVSFKIHRRADGSRWVGRNPTKTTSKSITRDDEVGGHAGELAAALMLGVDWTGMKSSNFSSNSSSNSADVGHFTQVRTLTRDTSRCLLVRPHDLEKYGNVPFVLVRRSGNRFYLLGWIWGFEAKTLGRMTDGGDKTRPPVYLVDQRNLRNMEDFKREWI